MNLSEYRDGDPACLGAEFGEAKDVLLNDTARLLEPREPIRLAAETTGRWNTGHDEPAAEHRLPVSRPREQTVAKFIQICASHDDLFALDEEGNVSQYNFNVKTWVKLVASRLHEGRRNDHRPRAAEPVDCGSMDSR
jgi:hypothetical protein